MNILFVIFWTLRPLLTRKRCYIFRSAYWIPGAVNSELPKPLYAKKCSKIVKKSMKIQELEKCFSQILGHSEAIFFPKNNKYLCKKPFFNR